MDKNGENYLGRFERQRTDYPLMIAAVVLCVLLIAGGITAARAMDFTAVALFIAAMAVFVILALIYLGAKRRRAALDDRKFIHWSPEMPELQRQNANIEVRELARHLGAGDDHSELLSAYVVATDLALRQIQQEESLPLMRHVSIGKTPFDGIMIDQDLMTCIEVAFLVKPEVRQDRVESMMKKAAQAKKTLVEMKSRLRVRLMLALVTQLADDEEEDLRATLGTKRFSDTPVDIDIRLFDFETLQDLYLGE
jgi:hypothetical protein